MNRTFARFARELKKDRYVESVQAAFLLLPSYRRFPGDEEFERDIKVRDLYAFRNRSYWLRRMENHERRERVLVDEYTIEHIMPQNEDLSTAWKNDLGPEWERIQQTWLHTLGNLTLTGYNSELSDKSFLEKRNLVGGFADSPLRMNEGLGKLDGWTEEAIQHRATVLAAKAGVIWSSPSLDRETLNAYRPQGVQSGSYTIDDHPHLVTGPMREVFEAFRREVLALDPVVGEDVRRVYVAYKAETNFVDIVPQARRLRLALNMRFPDINDPRGLCRDVTGMGRLGNGDVQFGLSRIEDVPYAVGLARQALENQMGCGEDA